MALSTNLRAGTTAGNETVVKAQANAAGLHYATDETVCCFGRDDGSLELVGQTGKDKSQMALTDSGHGGAE